MRRATPSSSDDRARARQIVNRLRGEPDAAALDRYEAGKVWLAYEEQAVNRSQSVGEKRLPRRR
jgi:hypothetical protein